MIDKYTISNSEGSLYNVHYLHITPIQLVINPRSYSLPYINPYYIDISTTFNTPPHIHSHLINTIQVYTTVLNAL